MPLASQNMEIDNPSETLAEDKRTMNRGRLLMHRGKTVEELTRHVQTDTDNVGEWLYYRACAYKANGCHLQAIQDYTGVLNYAASISTKRVLSCHYQQGISYFQLNEEESAVSSFLKVLKLDPEHINAKYHLGASLMALGRYSEGIHCYDEISKEQRAAQRGLSISVRSPSKEEGTTLALPLHPLGPKEKERLNQQRGIYGESGSSSCAHSSSSCTSQIHGPRLSAPPAPTKGASLSKKGLGLDFESISASISSPPTPSVMTPSRAPSSSPPTLPSVGEMETLTGTPKPSLSFAEKVAQKIARKALNAKTKASQAKVQTATRQHNTALCTPSLQSIKTFLSNDRVNSHLDAESRMSEAEAKRKARALALEFLDYARELFLTNEKFKGINKNDIQGMIEQHVIRLQAYARRLLCQMPYRQLKRLVVRIQTVYRGCRGRRIAKAKRNAVVAMQTQFRGYIMRIHLRKLRVAVAMIKRGVVQSFRIRQLHKRMLRLQLSCIRPDQGGADSGSFMDVLRAALHAYPADRLLRSKHMGLCTLMHAACREGNTEAMTELCSSYADLTAVDKYQRNAMQYVCMFPYLASLSRLAELVDTHHGPIPSEPDEPDRCRSHPPLKRKGSSKNNIEGMENPMRNGGYIKSQSNNNLRAIVAPTDDTPAEQPGIEAEIEIETETGALYQISPAPSSSPVGTVTPEQRNHQDRSAASYAATDNITDTSAAADATNYATAASDSSDATTAITAATAATDTATTFDGTDSAAPATDATASDKREKLQTTFKPQTPAVKGTTTEVVQEKVMKQGWLSKLCGGEDMLTSRVSLLRSWQRRYVVITDGYLRYYHDDNQLAEEPSFELSLQACSYKIVEEENNNGSMSLLEIRYDIDYQMYKKVTSHSSLTRVMRFRTQDERSLQAWLSVMASVTSLYKDHRPTPSVATSSIISFAVRAHSINTCLDRDLNTPILTIVSTIIMRDYFACSNPEPIPTVTSTSSPRLSSLRYRGNASDASLVDLPIDTTVASSSSTSYGIKAESGLSEAILCIAWLVSHGCDINATNRRGQSALHLALCPHKALRHSNSSAVVCGGLPLGTSLRPGGRVRPNEHLVRCLLLMGADTSFVHSANGTKPLSGADSATQTVCSLSAQKEGIRERERQEKERLAKRSQFNTLPKPRTIIANFTYLSLFLGMQTFTRPASGPSSTAPPIQLPVKPTLYLSVYTSGKKLVETTARICNPVYYPKAQTGACTEQIAWGWLWHMATPLEHIRPGSFVLVEMEDRVDQQSNQRKEKNQRNREPTSMENKNLVYTEDASVKKKQRDESNKENRSESIVYAIFPLKSQTFNTKHTTLRFCKVHRKAAQEQSTMDVEVLVTRPKEA